MANAAREACVGIAHGKQHHPYCLSRPRVGPSSFSSFVPSPKRGGWRAKGRNHCFCMPAFPLGNTGRRSARHPDRLAHVRIYLRRLPSCAGPRFSWPPVTHGTASVSQLLAGGPYWPPGGAPAPPGCVLCEARPRAPHPAPPRMTPHESAPRWTGRIGLYSV